MPAPTTTTSTSLRERALAGPAEDGGLRVCGQRAGAEQRAAGGGAAEQGAAGEPRVLEHNRHMAHNERIAACATGP